MEFKNFPNVSKSDEVKRNVKYNVIGNDEQFHKAAILLDAGMCNNLYLL